MTFVNAESKIDMIAAEADAALVNHRQIAPFSSRVGELTLAEAYQVASLLRAARESRGETITGRKVGFTNRQMWKLFGVTSPVWGYMSNSTTHDLADVPSVDLNKFCDARIEPEIIFGLGASPKPDMSEADLLKCVEWIAFGYEIVQSIFPGWKFSAADTVAANGLHGMLLIGKRHKVLPREAQWLNELAQFEVELFCDGKLIQRGGGSFVLDSPIRALRHLIDLLADDPLNPQLQKGEIISTGTLTLAMPVKAGESWTTKVTGIPLEDIGIQFA